MGRKDIDSIASRAFNWLEEGERLGEIVPFSRSGRELISSVDVKKVNGTFAVHVTEGEEHSLNLMPLQSGDNFQRRDELKVFETLDKAIQFVEFNTKTFFKNMTPQIGESIYEGREGFLEGGTMENKEVGNKEASGVGMLKYLEDTITSPERSTNKIDSLNLCKSKKVSESEGSLLICNETIENMKSVASRIFNDFFDKDVVLCPILEYPLSSSKEMELTTMSHLISESFSGAVKGSFAEMYMFSDRNDSVYSIGEEWDNGNSSLDNKHVIIVKSSLRTGREAMKIMAGCLADSVDLSLSLCVVTDYIGKRLYPIECQYSVDVVSDQL